MTDPKRKLDTDCIHGNLREPFPFGATSAPIVQSTGFEYASAEEMEQVFTGRRYGYLYSRIQNPTVSALEDRINRLEQGVGTLATASGMAAITVALLTLLRQGDTLVSGNSLFGGTLGLFRDCFAKLGIRIRYVEPSDATDWEAALKDGAKAAFVETIGNPKLDVPDLSLLSRLAHENHCPLVVDNTTATPYLFQAKNAGADIIIHSVSKYLNGNGNAVGGAITDAGNFTFDHPKFQDFESYRKRYGAFAFMAKARKEVFINFGPCLGPQNAFLQMLGIETFYLRMAKHCDNAMALANLFRGHSAVRSVYYPGLKDDPAHAVASRQFTRGFGGMICLDMGDKTRAFRLINGLTLAKRLANIGDARTLVLHPESTIYAEMPDEVRRAAGVIGGLVRVSVGLENIDDLGEDFTRVLDTLK